MKAFIAAGAALLVSPLLLLLLLGVAVIGGGSADAEAQAAAAAAVACTYGDPDPERIAVAMEQLGDPVGPDRYAAHAAAAGINVDAVPHSTSTAEQRHQVLVSNVRTSLYTVAPRTVATPVLTWWDAPLPTSDDDARWESTTVPGYGALGDYVTEFLNVYAVDPVVLAAVDTVSCTPRSAGRCLAPDDLEPILDTIRTRESGGDYQAFNDGNGDNPATGAYQFLDSTWNNYAGYNQARYAPPEVQDRRATEDIIWILEQHDNDVGVVPVVWYIGELPAADSPRWDTVPVPTAGNVLTLREYQTLWIDTYLQIAGPGADTCPTPPSFTSLAGPDCDGLKGTGATFNGKVNGTLSLSDLEFTNWGYLQPAAADAWRQMVDAAIADGWSARDFAGHSGGPGSRNGGYSNHTIGLAIDLNQLAWTPTRSVPGEPLPVAYAFDQPFYQWMRNNAWRYGWCNPRALRPHYLNGTATGGRAADGTGRYLEAWHFEFVGGSTHYQPYRAGDLNGPLGIPD